jgi:hypothetical protein
MLSRVVVSRWVLFAFVLLFAAVLFWSQAATGQSVRQQANDCRLYVPMVGNHFITYFEEPNEVEPNDSYLEANGPIRSSINYQGYPNDQKDWFSFYMPLAGQINVTLNNHTGQGVQLQLYYQNISNRVAFDSDDPYQVSYTGAAGWYYIYIYTASGTNSNALYTLNATYAVPPTPMSATPVATPTCPPAGNSTFTATSTIGPSPTTTHTSTPSATFTPGPSPTNTFTPEPTHTYTPSSTYTPTTDPTDTPTPSPTPTHTPTLPAGWYEVGNGSSSGGGISGNAGESRDASIAVAPNGDIYVTWRDDSSGNLEIYVKRWDWNSWEEVGTGSASGGGISQNSGTSDTPTIAISENGVPYIAWHDLTSGDDEIYVRRWNGSVWEEVGTGSAIGGGISNNTGESSFPVITIVPDETPYITWFDNTGGNYEIYVRRWNGSSWEEVGTGSASGGGISNNADTSWFPAMAIDQNGLPYISWHDVTSGDFEIYVRRWNGANWVEVGTGSATGGGISNNGGGSYGSSIGFDPVSQLPFITWFDDGGGDLEIYVRQWSGSAWVEVGTGSASGGGISNNSGISFNPAIAFESQGTPYITWYDESAGDSEIYIRRWNGASWEEVGTGSATDGGISNNSGQSYSPSIAVDAYDIIYVAWHDNSATDYEIYIKRHVN